MLSAMVYFRVATQLVPDASTRVSHALPRWLPGTAAQKTCMTHHEHSKGDHYDP